MNETGPERALRQLEPLLLTPVHGPTLRVVATLARGIGGIYGALGRTEPCTALTTFGELLDRWRASLGAS